MCLKGEKCSDGKVSKQRLTFLLCYNVEWDFKLPLGISTVKKHGLSKT